MAHYVDPKHVALKQYCNLSDKELSWTVFNTLFEFRICATGWNNFKKQHILHSCVRRSFCVFTLKLLDMNQSVHSLLIIISSWGSDFCWIRQPISFRRVIVISFVL
jgi:hypothetical protein